MTPERGLFRRSPMMSSLKAGHSLSVFMFLEFSTKLGQSGCTIDVSGVNEC